MRSTNAIALFLLPALMLAFSSAAQAFFGTADDYVLMLTSSDEADVISAARLIHKKYNGNQRVNDIAAQRLWNSLQDDAPLGEAATTLLVKAVGGSGSFRYQELLEYVRENAERNPRSWAKLGLKRMAIPGEVFEPDSIDLVQVRAEIEARAPMVNSGLQDDIQTASPRKILRQAERMYYITPILSNETLHLAMKFVEKNMSSSDPDLIQASSWICRVLGRTGSSKYSRILSLASKDGAPAVRKWAKEAFTEVNTVGGE